MATNKAMNRSRTSIARNKKRTAREVIPVPGLLGTAKRLQEPQPGEGFDRLYTVRLTEANEFVIEEPEEPAHSGM